MHVTHLRPGSVPYDTDFAIDVNFTCSNQSHVVFAMTKKSVW